MLRQTVRWTFIWSMGIAVIFMVIYHFGGELLLKMMTSDSTVIETAQIYMPWLLLMPVVGCAAFTWDGIYIGATASRDMRNSMLWATLAFVAIWAAGTAVLGLIHEEDSGSYGIAAVHILMAAYFAHLLARTIHLSVKYKKTVLSTPFV